MIDRRFLMVSLAASAIGASSRTVSAIAATLSGSVSRTWSGVGLAGYHTYNLNDGTAFMPLGGQSGTLANETAINSARTISRAAGTMRNMTAWTTQQFRAYDSSYQTYINGLVGNQIVIVPGKKKGSSSRMVDGTHVDVFAPGDTVMLSFTNGPASPSPYNPNWVTPSCGIQIDYTTPHQVLNWWENGPTKSFLTTAKGFIGPGGNALAAVIEAPTLRTVLQGANASNLAINTAEITPTALQHTLYSRKNGAFGNMAVPLGSRNVQAVMEDGTHFDPLAVGDTFTTLIGNGKGKIRWTAGGITLSGMQPNTSQMMSIANVGIIGRGKVGWWALWGATQVGTDLKEDSTITPLAGQLSNMTVTVLGNTLSSNSTFSMIVNQVVKNSAVILPAGGGASVNRDGTHIDPVLATDIVTIQSDVNLTANAVISSVGALFSA